MIAQRLGRMGALASLVFFAIGLQHEERAPAAEAKIEPAVTTPDHAIVPGFERFHAAADPTAVSPTAVSLAAGQLLLGELNCTTCHRAEKNVEPFVYRKQAPVLDSVGTRVKPSYLRKFLSAPQATKPGTTMPDLLAAVPQAERDASVEALVHFLASTGAAADHPVNPKAIASGERLYHQIGCVACHGPRGKQAAGPALATSQPLGDLSAKYTLPGLTSFLQDPLKVRPSGRMPAFSFQGDKEASEIAQYLLEDQQVSVRRNLDYSYYEGDWDKLPNFARHKPVATGQSAGFDTSVAINPGSFALRFTCVLEIDREGDYTFHVTSDDGSRLWIDDKLVVENDGIHPPSTKSGPAHLTPGLHPLLAEVFNGGGGCEMGIEIEGAGLARQSVDARLYRSAEDHRAAVAARGKSASEEERFQSDPALVTKGRELFARLGCASCHALQHDKQPIASLAEAKALARLKPGSGCLAGQPAVGAPRYALSTAQRAALSAAVSAAAVPAAPPTPKQTLTQTLTAFNCYACHGRDGIGGVEAARNAFFETNEKEMGDEGRLPPTLNGVGGKLKLAWLIHIFADGAKDRPYMLTRMPKFGVANVGQLVETFDKLDPTEPLPEPDFGDQAKQAKAQGRHMVGDKALGCVKCHNFRDVESTGIHGLNMTTMPKRLKREWFTRYVINPQAYRPGTRMPTAWPGGQSLLKKVLDGDTARQVEAIWLYLSDGDRAGLPYGLGRDPIELVATSEAVIYRNFIEGAGPRAIGVAYPEKANLAFDAGDLRLAMIWQGAFIDAAKHWIDRGAGFQGPLGDSVVHLPPGPGFAVLANPDDPWPGKAGKELGYQFRGYKLTSAQRPAFEYDLGEVHVVDLPIGMAGAAAPTLTRTLSITSDRPPDNLWYRAALGSKIESLADGWYKIDSGLKTRIQGVATPVIRKVAGKDELVVPVTGKQVRLVQEYVW